MGEPNFFSLAEWHAAWQSHVFYRVIWWHMLPVNFVKWFNLCALEWAYILIKFRLKKNFSYKKYANVAMQLPGKFEGMVHG